MNAIPSYPPRLSPTAVENVRAADRISIEVIGTVVDRPRWGIAWSTREGVRGFACEDRPEDYPGGAPADHTPGQGLVALFACPDDALDAIAGIDTDAHIYDDGIPQTLDAADAIDAERLEDGRWADHYQARFDKRGLTDLWYCRDCGALVADDVMGCSACGYGQWSDEEVADMEEPMDLEDRLNALLEN